MYDYISSQVNRVGANDQKIVKGGSYDYMILIVLNYDGVGQDVTDILTLHDYSKRCATINIACIYSCFYHCGVLTSHLISTKQEFLPLALHIFITSTINTSISANYSVLVKNSICRG